MTTTREKIAAAINSCFGTAQTDWLIAGILGIVKSETAALTKERDAARAEAATIRVWLVNQHEKYRSPQLLEFLQQPDPGQPLLDRLAAAEAMLAANQREVSRLMEVVKGLANDKKNLASELARIKAAIEAVPLEELADLWRGFDGSTEESMAAVRNRLLAEFDKPTLTPFPTEFAKATAAIYAEQPIIRDDPDAKPQTLTEVVATIPETVQKYEAMHSPQPRPNIVLRELPLEIPEEKTWGKEGVEIAKAVLSDAAKCDKPSTDPASQFAQAVRDRIQSAGCWATDFVGQVAAEELKRLGCCMISAARLAELEAYEADAKRWRACVKRGLFPMQAFGRWHIWGQGEYLTPEAAVDAATKGGGE